MTQEAPSDYTTLAEVLDRFEADGFTGAFEVSDTGELQCLACGTNTPAEDVCFLAIRRLEGASDPADMAAVIATECAGCAQRGVVVTRYGPEASPGEAALLAAGRDQCRERDGGGDTAPGETHREAGRLDPDAPGRSLFVDDEDAVEPNEPA